MITTTAILTNIQYGVPSGPYDGFSQDWVSEPVQAADYYRGRGNVQTVTFDVTDLEARLLVEATMDTTADSASWVTVAEIGGDSTAISLQQAISVQGNFTWMRIRVLDFSAGTINLIQIRY